MARCLVLGANGFIGSHLVDQLLSEGHFVRCFDRYRPGDKFYADEKNSSIEIFPGDFLNKSSLENALEGIEYVFHFISTTTPITSENDPSIDIETNIPMSIVLFNLCVEKNIKRIIFASTGGAIYGNVPTNDLISEEVYPKPVSPYAIGKLTIENYLRYFNTKHGLNYLVLRISNPYGPRQNTSGGQGVIPIFLEKVKNNEPITIYGDGTMVRDYVFVEDVAQMISGCFDKNIEKNGIYNIGSGQGNSVNDLVNIVRSVSEKELVTNHKETPSTFVNHITLDVAKFKMDFNLTATTDLDEGIRQTWQALQ